MKNPIKKPRWYYRDVQLAMKGIVADAATAGSVKASMVAFLAQRADKLPDGKTPEAVADEILCSVDAFAVAHREGKTAEDVKAVLVETVATMDTHQALAYLATLDCAFCACDHMATGTGRAPTAEELREAICQAAEGGADDIAAQIDSLAARVQGDSLTAYVYAVGNDELKDLVSGREDLAEGIDPDVAARIQSAIVSQVNKGEVYAATACASYGMVLDGKIPGVTAESTDVATMTTLVVAGLEKASILARLARGEIDAEMARDLLRALVPTVKWLLVKAAQAVLVVGTAGLVIAALPKLFVWILTTAGMLTALGLVAGFVVASSSEEDLKSVVDFMTRVAETVVRGIARAAVWVFEKVAGRAQPAVATA